MIYDTNLLITHVRQKDLPPVKTILSIITIGELEAFALKSDWGIQKVDFMLDMIARYPNVDVTRGLVRYYAEIDAFSQGKLKTAPLNLEIIRAKHGQKRHLDRSYRALLRYGVAHY